MLLRLFPSRKYWDFDTISPHVAKELTATWLYGTTRHTIHQRKSRNAAMEHGFSLSVLTMDHGRVEKRGPFAYWVSAYGLPARRNTTCSPCSVPAENLRINPANNTQQPHNLSGYAAIGTGRVTN